MNKQVPTNMKKNLHIVFKLSIEIFVLFSLFWKASLYTNNITYDF